MQTTRLLNEHEAAEALSLSVLTLRRWRWAGSPLPFVRLGRAIRYDPHDIARFIERSKRRSTSEPEERR